MVMKLGESVDKRSKAPTYECTVLRPAIHLSGIPRLVDRLNHDESTLIIYMYRSLCSIYY